MMLCRHIDCAKAYQNQTGLGQALQELYKEGKVSRKDFWLTTKLWNTDHAEVRKNCLESMKELQTEYLDLYLVHWPVTQHKGPALTPSMKVGICLSSERERLQCFSQTYSAPTEGCKSPLLRILSNFAASNPSPSMSAATAFCWLWFKVTWLDCSSKSLHDKAM